MTKKVSLYIPCFNAAGTIAQCIEAVLNQTYPAEEIIIVDDASTDNTKTLIQRFPVKIISHNTNKGLASTRNTGILNSKNEFVASLDADCVPEPDWLEKLMETVSKDTPSPSPLPPGERASIARVRGEPIAGAGGQLLEANLNTIADQWRKTHLKQSWGSKTIANPRHLFGNNTIFRKSALTDVGLYNPKYKTNSEDYDISRRLKEKGHTLIYNPQARVKHIRRDTVRSVMNTYCEYYYFGYIRKINILNTIRGILVNLFFSTSFFFKDLLKGRIKLLPLDILSFILAIPKNLCPPHPSLSPEGRGKGEGQNESILAFFWGDWPRPDPNGPQCGPLVSLSRKNKILIVESPITLLSPFLRRNRSRGRYLRRLEKINPQLSVFTPILLLPYHPRLPLPTWTKKLLNKINNPLISFQVNRRLKKLNISNPILWLSMLHPEELTNKFRHKLICVMCYDEVGRSPIFTKTQQQLIKEFEEKLLRKADIVFTTSKTLCSTKTKLNPKTYLIPNAVETEFIDKINSNSPPGDIENIPFPRIGYIGKINIRLDFKLIYNIAKDKPQWQWVFIGPVEKSADKHFINRLMSLKNIHFLGEKSHFEIARYLRHFDVFTIPFVINEYTKNMNPLKLYQYLASGKPIVSTNLPEAVGLSSTASSELEFINLLDQALKENNPHLIKKRIELARSNTWDKRATTISEILNENITHIQ